jgi:hypothetical protein
VETDGPAWLPGDLQPGYGAPDEIKTSLFDRNSGKKFSLMLRFYTTRPLAYGWPLHIQEDLMVFLSFRLFC